ncbi:MAG: histidinol-phosphatase [candidate division Zixibacteria bacterium]|nr:histidinol-phosphatase [candidate division Zixibacteria bacterium]
MPDNYKEIVGAIHIHSKFSDGTKSIQDIASIANEVNLDFIMVSDHMTLEPYHQGIEGFYGNTAVIIGYEINDPDDKNHYLAFGLNEVLPSNLQAEQYVPLVKQNGGLGIIAHPDEVRTELSKYPGYPWTKWQVDGYDGIEIWNHMSQWMELLNRWNMIKQAFMPRRALKAPTDMILKIWDEVNLKRKVLGVGSIDVHAYPYRLGPLRITVFPYKVQFKAIRTHILLPKSVSSDFKAYKLEIYNALRNCRAFISNYRWGDAQSFKFIAENSSGKAICGDELNWDKNTIIKAYLPQRADIRLICNGQIVFSDKGKDFSIRTLEPGLYRLEAYINKKGWIFTNHVRLMQKQA